MEIFEIVIALLLACARSTLNWRLALFVAPVLVDAAFDDASALLIYRLAVGATVAGLFLDGA